MSGEKTYTVMSSSGVTALASGIVVIVIGVAAGIMMSVTGARLLAGKKDVLI